MFLDQTRYESFWRNPDKFRLTYVLNLVPRTLAYGLARGTAFHIIAEELANGRERAEIDKILRGQIPGSRGQIEPIEEKAIANAWALGDALVQHPSSHEITLIPEGCEREFLVQIPGSPHFMAGRVDQIMNRHGEVWVGELKSANPKARYDSFLEDWKNKKQADFVLVGAKSLGFDPVGVYVRQVVEGNPPKVWELEERRSESALQVSMLNVHQTCEIIEMLKNTFGSDVPWPHLCSLWPCSVAGKCEYESLCRRDARTFTANDLEDFKIREEHLEIIRNLHGNDPTLLSNAPSQTE